MPEENEEEKEEDPSAGAVWTPCRWFEIINYKQNQKFSEDFNLLKFDWYILYWAPVYLYFNNIAQQQKTLICKKSPVKKIRYYNFLFTKKCTNQQKKIFQ